MNSNFSLKVLGDFRLPGLEIGIWDWSGAVDTDTKS